MRGGDWEAKQERVKWGEGRKVTFYIEVLEYMEYKSGKQLWVVQDLF